MVFELAYYNVTVQYITHYATRTPRTEIAFLCMLCIYRNNSTNNSTNNPKKVTEWEMTKTEVGNEIQDIF